MRAPPEVPYLFALESAMDEPAHALQLDPVELRRRNDAAADPVTGKAFTTRPLMRCFDAAAAAFGWDQRRPAPRTTLRDGWWIGHGCAAAGCSSAHREPVGAGQDRPRPRQRQRPRRAPARGNVQ